MKRRRLPDTVYGARLRRNLGVILARKGWDALDLYKRCKMTRSQYHALFKASRGPTLLTIDRLAKVLGVGPEELIKGDA